MDWADVYFGLRGGLTLDLMHARFPAAALAANQAAMARSRRCAGRRRAGAWFACPTRRWRDKPIPIWTLEDMFFAACLLDYPAGSAGLAGGKRERL